MEIILYLIAGGIAGVMSGLLGLGGGIIVVPALSFSYVYLHMFKQTSMHVAVGTSLAIMMVTTASSAYAHYRRGNLLLPLFLRLIFGIVIGVAIGAFVAGFLSTRVLHIIFGAFLLIAGMRLCYTSYFASDKFEGGQTSMPGKLGMFIMSPFIGFCSGMLGIGTGTISVPYLSQHRFPMKNIAAVSSLCSFPVAIVGAISYILTGLGQTHAAYTSGYIHWPSFLFVSIGSVIGAPIGARLATVWDSLKIKRGFTIVLFLLAIRMLWSGIAC